MRGGGEVIAGVKGREGTERLRDMELEDNDVAVVATDGDRESEKLPFIEIEELEWFENRGALLAE